MIKNIIFDFGDVFINLDKLATERKIKNHFGSFDITPEIDTVNQNYEKGELTSDEFINFYASHFNTTHTNVLSQAWNAIILDFPEHRLKFIEKLAHSKQYKLILLSNTNALHIEQVIKNMTLERYQRFKNCFDALFYLSHEINLRKPDTTIFKFVLKQNNIKAEETLFIDDTPQNTKRAAQLGFHTWTLNPNHEDITDLLSIKKSLF